MIVVGVLIVFRAVLPYLGLHFINKALRDDLGTYVGQIKDFDLSLYRGAYQLQGLTIKKKDAAENIPPLVEVNEIDLSLSWRALFQGKIALDVFIDHPKFSPSDSAADKKSQTGTEEPVGNWRDALETLFPIHLQSLVVQNGELEFVNRDLKEPLPVKISQAELTVKNIQTHSAKTLSPFHFQARLQDQADVNVDGKVNFLSEVPQADLDFKLTGFHLESINKVLRAYIPLDITKSLFSLYGEVVTQNGNMDGYVKVFLQDADIVASDQEIINVKHFFVEIFSAFGNWILQNSDTDKVAAKIPFSYHDGNFNVDSSEAFWSAVKNQADSLKPGIEHSLQLK